MLPVYVEGTPDTGKRDKEKVMTYIPHTFQKEPT
jgi:hypothetical protein